MAVASAIDEVQKATEMHPDWPTDPLHALAIVTEELGELYKTILQNKYEGKHPDVNEAVQTAAMALRFLANWPNYEFEEPQP
jgi:NTP pyrophosphatase (non-canonical NTP hydrolase)